MHPILHQQAKTRQRGAALMVMLVIVVMGTAAALVGSLGTTALKNARQEKTSAALAQAKDALIGYAVSDKNRPGELPCPDVNNDGLLSLNVDYTGGTGSPCVSLIGRLPWKTLGLPDLRDASGEHLWYVVSDSFHAGSVDTLNSDAVGMLSLTGNVTANNLIAIVFTPGLPLSTQSRSSANENTYSHYLESVVTPPTSFQFSTSNDHAGGTHTYNDQMILITYADLMPLVEKRIAREAKKCLDDYADGSGGKYPWATPVSDTSNYLGTIDTLFGRIPRTPAMQTDPTSNVAGFIDALSTLQFQLTQLQSALNNYSSTLPNPTKSARNGLTTAGENTKEAGKAMEDIADSATDPITDTIAEPAEKAGDKGEDAGDLAKKLAKDPPKSTTAEVQSKLDKSQLKIDETIAELAAADLIDETMKLTWPDSCTTFVATYWNDWKDLVFYQVADGYKPGSGTPACGSSPNTCLSIEGSGHNLAGSGSYRATVIVAGKKLLTQSRPTSNADDYLDGNNQFPTNAYQTHRITDAAYQSVNDLVLCLDGHPLNVNAYCK